MFKLSDNPADFQLRFFIEAAMSMAYTISFSSFMLVESDTPVEWVPDAEAIDQSVEAKLSLYVKTDTDGNLVSAIHAKANQITIESDNFTLDGEGNMTCNNANITGGKIYIGADNTGIYIEDGTLRINYGEITTLSTDVEMSVDPVLTGAHIYTAFNLYGGQTFKNSQYGTLARFSPGGSVSFPLAKTNLFSDGLNITNGENIFSVLGNNVGLIVNDNEEQITMSGTVKVEGNLIVSGYFTEKTTFSNAVCLEWVKGATPAGSTTINNKTVRYTWLAADVDTGELFWRTPEIHKGEHYDKNKTQINNKRT